MDFIRNNIDYPFEARRRGIQGTVSVGFVILNNGQIIGARVLNVADKSLSKEALRVVSLTQKKWTPGKIENNSVNSFILIPVTFKLQ